LTTTTSTTTTTYALKNPMETLTGRHCGTVFPSIRTTLKATAWGIARETEASQMHARIIWNKKNN